MNTFCANCGTTMSFYQSGNLYLFNNKYSVNPIGEGVRVGMHSYLLPYDNLDSLYRKLEGTSRKLIEEDWKCSISATEVPVDFYPAEEFLNKIKHRDMIGMIQTGNFVSYLQPIIDLDHFELFAYESLLRNADPSLTFNPGALFEAALLTGFHSLLDQRARRTAIESRIGNVDKGVKSFINFLPSTIYNPDFCLKHTFEIVDKYGVDPEDLVFEVVETEKIEDVNHLKSVLEVYKREGMKVALDDVGSGFSTIEMLSLLQPDYVKIDRSYISECDMNTDKQQFLKNVIHIARELGISVLAEGVERKEELTFCKAAGVEYAQGYLIGKPALHAEKPLVPYFV
ncbi:EAL domain-containing protein [Bacillus sp. Marseille-Q1617]|uniref:EAL domain-containing protein n=1 Tax=Bacillus sp. Marseille-Q1617 TaxID=2736887 RepID=UPI0020CA5344|nr:EAL domain-containing protein [Bacillus sp. Marseille-Q1617]